MKFINWLINYYATPSLIIGSIVTALTGIILALAIIFNFNPYFSRGSKPVFGYTNFAKGIPVKVSITNRIPDTSIYYKKITGERLQYIYPEGPMLPPEVDEPGKNPIIYSDTVLTQYQVSGGDIDQRHKLFSVKNLSFSEGNAYIKTNSFFYRLLLASTYILVLFLLSYCFWQVGMLLHYIQNGGIFELINYKRLQNIGFAIVIFQLFCLAIGFIVMFTKYDWNLKIMFSSNIPHFISPVIIQAEPEYGFDGYWLVGGCIIVTIAKAFQRGYTLQKEQDLTI